MLIITTIILYSLMAVWIVVGVYKIILMHYEIKNEKELLDVPNLPNSTEELKSILPTNKTFSNDLTKPFALDEFDDDPADWWKREQEGDEETSTNKQ